MKPTVLISGAGITGPALALWLHRFGFQPTVVERAAGIQSAGQAVDLRGAALRVVEAMGLIGAARELRTHLKGMSILDAEGHEAFRSEGKTTTSGPLDNGDIEIFRDDLCQLLINNTRDVEYIYSDSVTSLAQKDASVAVSFEHQAPREFGVVIAADGIRSRVRNLVFGEDDQYLHPLGFALAFYTIPNLLNLKDWQLAYRDAERGYVSYPNRDNSELRVGFAFRVGTDEDTRMPVEAQKAMVEKKCAHFKGDIPKLLAAMQDSPNFYFGEPAQVRMTGWSRGRVVLAGDAAHCPSPFTGQGTSLALVGAYVLARELARTPAEPAGAFERYEARMQPFVLVNHRLVTPGSINPIDDDVRAKAANGIALDDLVAAPS